MCIRQIIVLPYCGIIFPFVETYEDMPAMREFDDPLDAAFANPKAGKKLKAGESLPGLGRSQESSARSMSVPDAALSLAFDDAFSNPDFGKKPHRQAASSRPAVTVGISETELAQTIDDAFANPKAGKKIPENKGDVGSMEGTHPGVGDLDLTYRASTLHASDANSSRGLLSPKTLVIGMVLLMCVLAALSLGQGAETGPTILRLNN